jgi:uncharacterized protein involved in cysteine biosynthesis
MKGEVTENSKKIKNTKQGGFLELIVLIIVALLVMKYMGLTVSEVINWFKSFFGSVLR